MTVSTTLVTAFPPASFDDECECLRFNTFLLESTVTSPGDPANFPRLIQLVRRQHRSLYLTWNNYCPKVIVTFREPLARASWNENVCTYTRNCRATTHDSRVSQQRFVTCNIICFAKFISPSWKFYVADGLVLSFFFFFYLLS